GLRIGTGPRGHYIHAGRGGLYYRATLGKAGQGRQPLASPQRPISTRTMPDGGDVAMIEIESGDVLQMRDTSFSELLDEINAKAKQMRMSVALALAALAIGATLGLATGGPGLLLCAMALPAGLAGKWLDSYRRTTVLYYELEGDAEASYRLLAKGYDGLIGCAAKWHIEAGGAVQSLTAWKRNAGASHLVKRKLTTLVYALPAVVKSNITPPALQVGRQVMFFMPDIVLMQDGARLGAVSYADLKVQWQHSRFIETERVPNDAKIVGHTWKHPNKAGGPDRRFKDNRQIPICLYETMHLNSATGVNELVEFSKTEVAAQFADGCRMLAALPRQRTITPALPMPELAAVNVNPVDGARKRSLVRASLLTSLSLLVGVSGLAVLLGNNGKETADAKLPPNRDGEVTNASGSTETTFTEQNGAEPARKATTSHPKTEQTQTDTKDAATGNNALYTKTDVNLREGPGTRYAIIMVVPK
ncbi:DUF4236 domain-containing protein, partial [Salmonella enterica subsp. enterica]|nr:DUF4236 domain-containing protein [Salmonella enterica subsp. enterica]